MLKDVNVDHTGNFCEVEKSVSWLNRNHLLDKQTLELCFKGHIQVLEYGFMRLLNVFLAFLLIFLVDSSGS